MTSTNQQHFDLKTQDGWDQFRRMLISSLGEDLQGRLNGTSTETDANKAEVQRQKEQDQKHRDHLRRVRDLERNNRSRNSER